MGNKNISKDTRRIEAQLWFMMSMWFFIHIHIDAPVWILIICFFVCSIIGILRHLQSMTWKKVKRLDHE